MTEPTEQWRKEFEKAFIETQAYTLLEAQLNMKNLFTQDPYADSSAGEEQAGYHVRRIDDAWQGFLLAKRALIVGLPKPEMCFGRVPFAYFKAEPVIEQLRVSGINFKIQGFEES